MRRAEAGEECVVAGREAGEAASDVVCNGGAAKGASQLCERMRSWKRHGRKGEKLRRPPFSRPLCALFPHRNSIPLQARTKQNRYLPITSPPCFQRDLTPLPFALPSSNPNTSLCFSLLPFPSITWKAGRQGEACDSWYMLVPWMCTDFTTSS